MRRLKFKKQKAFISVTGKLIRCMGLVSKSNNQGVCTSAIGTKTKSMAAAN